MSHMKYWDKVKQPPAGALKAIQAGRLKGKSDISPMWRYQAMTELFGPCGIGWKYTIDKQWTEPAANGAMFCFVDISLYIKVDGAWSDAIPGSGGDFIIEKEREGLHSNDEGFKMATTDALGTAMKMLGVAADVYMGLWDGSKYNKMRGAQVAQPAGQPPQGQQQGTTPTDITPKHAEYQQRIITALKAIFGDDKASALNEVERLTAFKGKDDKMVPGKRDFMKLSEKASSILCHSLEKRLADMQGKCDDQHFGL